MGGRLVRIRRPGVALPVGQVRRGFLGHALPPDAAVVREGDVGEDAVALGDGAHGVGVGAPAGARGDAEQAGLRVGGAQLAFLADPHPGDVVTKGLNLPALDGGVKQGEVGLAAGRREGGGHVVRLLLRGGELEDKHVLGKPALVPGHHGSDAQGVALLAQEGVSAVAGAERPDGTLLREVDNPLVRVARPCDVGLAGGQGGAQGVQCGNEERVRGGDLVQHFGADVGHDAHGGNHVGAVSDLHAEFGILCVKVAHDERDDVHGAAAHGTGEQAAKLLLHLGRRHPVIGEAGIPLVLRADECLLFNARHVRGIGECGEGVREQLRVQPGQRSGFDQLAREAGVFLFRTVDPVDAVRLGKFCNLFDPCQQASMCCGCFLKQRQSCEIAHCGSLPRVQWCVLNARALDHCTFWVRRGMSGRRKSKNRGKSRKWMRQIRSFCE
ncbi:hypothetical protein D9M72_353180 [compost metagenome]